jgi:hypothetical protein
LIWLSRVIFITNRFSNSLRFSPGPPILEWVLATAALANFQKQDENYRLPYDTESGALRKSCGILIKVLGIGEKCHTNWEIYKCWWVWSKSGEFR